MGLFDKLNEKINSTIKDVAGKAATTEAGEAAKGFLNAMNTKVAGAMTSKGGVAGVLNKMNERAMAEMGVNPDGAPATPESREIPPNPTCLEKLDLCKGVPRRLEGRIGEIVGKAPFVGKAEWLEEAKTMLLVYTYVVQAHSDLYSPSDLEGGGLVVIFTREDGKTTNANYLKGVAEKLQALREADSVPPEAVKLVELLNDSDSAFVEEVPMSLTDGVRVICAVVHRDAEDLPRTFLPDDRILPAFSRYEAEVGLLDGLQFIKPEFYI